MQRQKATSCLQTVESDLRVWPSIAENVFLYCETYWNTIFLPAYEL